MDRLSLIQYKDYGNRSIIIINIDPKTIAPKIDRTQANRSIIPTGYKNTPQYRSIEPQTLKLSGFSSILNDGLFAHAPRINAIRISQLMFLEMLGYL
jgi:hypothetical protein